MCSPAFVPDANSVRVARKLEACVATPDELGRRSKIRERALAVYREAMTQRWPVDGDSPLAAAVALQRMQPHALERADVVQSLARCDAGQDVRRRPGPRAPLYPGP